ncbi:hypothetical protein BU25DRAFT_386135 [Macroventuria anomochaeta]|uniref:Uncharacterized protein n=1 Tax=Macroventuria anomochaeta TaxID=301207 RepID=A0ACB6SAM5_9PLEO|nr:uncharacterized protein BU25DRAFT_386135 [Macroventuria anomochaeta]KAF2631181.1 hypothetical protein BU25DRAFT_386135 [Macroventuria anomochaeta]
MEEYDISERSLLNATPETIVEIKDDSSFYKVPLQTTTSAFPSDHASDLYDNWSPRKRERVAFRLDSWADWIWDTSANVLQLKTTGKGWTAELCSYVFAVLSLFSLAATLLAHQGKPLPEWPQLITINSIVSLFSLLMRAGIGLVLAECISQSKWQWFRKARKLNDMERFDAASRGALGSVALLFHTKPERLSFIVALGAMVTILAALTGFFLQQLVVFEDCLQRNPAATVRISKTNYCKAAYQGVGSTYVDAYPPMVAAINAGMIQSVPDHTSAVSHGCSSGNCTFPSEKGMSFSTVAVGHSCENITTRIHGSRRPDHLAIITLPTSGNGSVEVCPACDDPKVAIGTRAEVVRYNGSATLGTIFILYRANANGSIWQAMNCSLLPTVNTYAVNITNSIMNETLIDSVQIPSSDDASSAYSHRLVTNRTLRNGVWKDCTGATNLNPQLDETTEVDDRIRVGSMYYPKDCVWSFGKSAADSIFTYLVDLFNGENLYWTQDSTTTEFLPGEILPGDLVPPRRRGPIHLRQFYGNGTLDQEVLDHIMGNITSAMTTVVRTYNTEGPAWDAKGDMWTATTCIRIDWRWISFPTIMMSLTGVFLVLVIIDNRGVDRERLWKSSVLATLFCEVDHGIEGNAHLISKRSMYDVAKSTSVSLEGTEGTLKLLAK